MDKPLLLAICAYLIAVNILGIIICVYDKVAAKGAIPRIKERTLIGISVFGASPAMLLCMLLIRHKTKHAKFMFGLPIIIALQAYAIYFIIKRLL